MDKILAELLLNRGHISKEKLQAAVLEQTVTKERLSKILIRNGFIRQNDMFRIMREINPNSLHDEGVFQNSIPPELLLKTKTMIVAMVEGTLYLSTLTSPNVVRELVKGYTSGMNVVFTAANPVRMQEYFHQLRTGSESNLLSWEKIFYDAMQKRATDIHILPRSKSYTILLRVDGVLQLAHEGLRDEYIALVSRVKDLSKMDMAERRRNQDGSFAMDYAGRIVNFRVVTVPNVNGEKMVVRILDPDTAHTDITKLGITRLDVWRQALARPDGLCLIAGPTGSGKTTTLAASAYEMNFLERSLYFAEDPVENQVPYACHTNINPSVGMDFPGAIRAFMRSDPDVIITGEMRDIETARNAIKAAETGHLSIGTLHTGSILQAFGRLRDIGVQPYELYHILRGVMVQRLLRTYCSKCHGAGCSHCDGVGYKGRCVVSEAAYFENEADVRAAIDGHVSWPTIEQDARDKVLAGVTSQTEFERVLGIPMDSVK